MNNLKPLKILIPHESQLYALACKNINAAITFRGGAPLKIELLGRPGENQRNAVILADLDNMPEMLAPVIKDLSLLHEKDAFVISPVGENVVIIAQCARAVLYGASHLVIHLLEGRGKDIKIKGEMVWQKPFCQLRGSYTLSFNGLYNYPFEFWEKAFTTLVENGYNHFQLFTAGCFPSRLFPETIEWQCDYIGRAIDFLHNLGAKAYLLSGVGGWFGMCNLITRFPEIRITWPEKYYQSYTIENTRLGICPTRGKKIMMDYLEEMYKAYPQADGMSLEIYCEKPHCQCAVCQEKGLWRIELDFLKEFSAHVWQWKKEAEFIWFIGYERTHGKPPESRLYEEIARLNESRYLWFYVRTMQKYVDSAGIEHSFLDPATYKLISTNGLIAKLPVNERYDKKNLSHGRKNLLNLVKESGLKGIVWCPDARYAFLPGYDPDTFGYLVKKRQPAGVNIYDDILMQLHAFILGQILYYGLEEDEEVATAVNKRFFGGELNSELLGEIMFLYELVFEVKIMAWLSRHNLYSDGPLQDALAVIKGDYEGTTARLKKGRQAMLNLRGTISDQAFGNIMKLCRHMEIILDYLDKMKNETVVE